MDRSAPIRLGRRLAARLLVLMLAAVLAGPVWAQADPARGLELRILLLLNQNRFEEAARTATSLVAERAALGEPVALARAHNTLGVVVRRLGRLDQAEAAFRAAVAGREAALGPDHKDTLVSRLNLALTLKDLGRDGEAVPQFERVLAAYQRAFGTASVEVAQVLNQLGLARFRLGDYVAAERLHRRALEIRLARLAADDRAIAASRNNLANALTRLGRYAEAEALLGQAIAAIERRGAAGRVSLIAPLNNLANIHMAFGRYGQAEAVMDRAQALAEAAFGRDHPIYANFLVSRAGLYGEYARLEDATNLYRQALEIYRTALGAGDRRVALGLNNLATIYLDYQRFDEAEPLFEQAYAIYRRTLPANHPDLSDPLANLAIVYGYQGLADDARGALEKALALREAAYGPDHPAVASILNDLGVNALAGEDYGRAEALFQRARRILAASFGPDSIQLNTVALNLGLVKERQGDFAAAERFYRQSLALIEQAVGRAHPTYGAVLAFVAELQRKQGALDQALETAREVSRIFEKRAERLKTSRARTARIEMATARKRLIPHIAVIAELIRDRGDPGLDLTAESFEVAQLTESSKASSAIAAMAARFAAGGGALARTVRERQDALAEWQAIDDLLIAQVGRAGPDRDSARETALRARRDALATRLDQLDSGLAIDFPDYAELAGGQPLSLFGVKNLLDADEALVTYVVTDAATYAWVVRSQGARLVVIDLGAEDLKDLVGLIRASVDPSRVRTTADIPPFDFESAYTLYQALVAPLEPDLTGAGNVFIVADGALQSLPFGLLLTAPFQPAEPGFRAYARAPWLARRLATTILPSVGSLRALRQFARAPRATKPFIGYGDPVLEGEAGSQRGLAVRGLYRRNALGDVTAIKALAPLPETADELRSLARALGAEETASVRLGPAATERAVRRAPLADYRVIAFATHGLTAGDFQGLAEPALVLTPPETASPDDDGLLTASEIAELRLDASWVILSACNTAAPDGTPGAEGLSGLAKAFFYAGSRTLMVSHWPVGSDAAKRLTTATLTRIAAEPDIGRSEALRQAMLELMNDPTQPYYAHPMFWAPFFLVGRGGRLDQG